MIEVHPCLSCGKPTEVNRIIPIPPGEKKCSGSWVSWMDENYREHTIGVVCDGCFIFDRYGMVWDGYSATATIESLKDVPDWCGVLPEFKRYLERLM